MFKNFGFVLNFSTSEKGTGSILKVKHPVRTNSADPDQTVPGKQSDPRSALFVYTKIIETKMD